MQNPYAMPQKEARKLIVRVMENLSQWSLHSTEAFREAMLNGAALVNPLIEFQGPEVVLDLSREIGEVIRKGRMVDFGFISNDVIKQVSQASRPLYEAGELPQPYDRWIALSRWEGGACAYYISPLDARISPRAIAIVEIYGLNLPATDYMLAHSGFLVNDIVMVEVVGERTDIIVTPLRVSPGGPDLNTKSHINRRAGNTLDPMVTFLRLLADASVPVERVVPSAQLNKARARRGKPPIPSHLKVDATGYVTALKAASHRPGKGGDGQGTHASPIAHERRGHLRHMRSGLVVSVRSSKVNWRSNEELARLFYTVDR